MLEYIILGFLKEADLSGYDIKQFMSVSTANFFDASFGSIYPALKRLEEKGMITSTESIESGKFKKYYSIQEPGNKAFLEWLEESIDFTASKHDHLVKVFFFKHLPPDKIRHLINEFIKKVEKTLENLKKTEAQAEDHADFFQMSTLYFGKEFYAHLISWYTKLLEQIENQPEISRSSCKLRNQADSLDNCKEV